MHKGVPGRTAAWCLRPERHSCLLAAVAGYPVRVSLPQGCSGGLICPVLRQGAVWLYTTWPGWPVPWHGWQNSLDRVFLPTLQWMHYRT
ncbi:hypothetical protein LHGZ1_3483 [Laribacter hongkongensis]|uniref:Uncharacterized protein n=1 Tax=Laribacter hongkongensis TaxID=168471 RepID=A0A248LPH2_9NEIS|nr:hypothetical protein LHGZ1_3483 [Laribacter hongkongensis]